MFGWINSHIESNLYTAANAEDKREKIRALSLAKECCSMKLDLNRSTEAATIW
jgi:hypothetical protein